MEITNLKDKPQFIPDLARVIHNEWGYLYPRRTVGDLKSALQKNLNTDRVPLTLIAVENDALVGTVSLEAYDMETRMEYTPWLASLYVLPEYRNTGLARKLVERATAQAGALGVQTLYLFTLKPHARFYETRGWQVLEKTVYRGERVTILALHLSQNKRPAAAI